MKKNLKKKRVLLLLILLILLNIALVPLSVLVTSINVFIIYIVIMAMILTAYIFFKEYKGKWKKIIASIVICLSLLFSIFNMVFNPYMNSVSFRQTHAIEDVDQIISRRQATQDVEYLMKKLERTHPALMEETPIEVRAAYEGAIESIENGDEYISINELQFLIRPILSPLRDGHTSAYIQHVTRHYFKYLWELQDQGFTIDSVNGMTAKSILEERNEQFSYEIEAYALSGIESQMFFLEGLRDLGFVVDDGIEYKFINESGDIHLETYLKDDFLEYDACLAYYGDDYEREAGSNDRSFVGYELMPDENLAIFYLDMCRYNDIYIETVEAFFKDLKETDIENIAVDIRDNPGGSSAVVNEFIRYLDVDTYNVDTLSWRFGPIMIHSDEGKAQNDRAEEYTYYGDLYVLTSVDTFSSGMMFAQYIGDNNLGRIIGESPGNVANGYGEVVRFQLPNSKITFGVSSKIFRRADYSLPTDIVEVDVACDSKDCMDVLISLIR